jgi:predicted dehydrogenase
MKLAIIGSFAGHYYPVMESLATLKDVQLLAAARFGPEDPLSFVGTHPGAPKSLPVYDDYRVMLDEIQPDVVAIFSPPFLNAALCVAAARRGCHVCCDKPLATTHEDLAAVRIAAAESRKTIVAMLTMRGEPAVIAVRQAVQAGRLGRPILALGQKSYPFATRDDFYKTRRTYGGSIPWQAIHALDFLSYCCGKDYARVAAMQSCACHPTHPGMEDNGGLLLQFVGGGHAMIAFDYLRPWSPGVKRNWGGDKIRIVGSEATVETFDDFGRVELTTPTGVEPLPLGPARNLFADFVGSLGTGQGAPITQQESFRMTEIALKARDAADSGTIVNLA